MGLGYFLWTHIAPLNTFHEHAHIVAGCTGTYQLLNTVIVNSTKCGDDYSNTLREIIVLRVHAIVVTFYRPQVWPIRWDIGDYRYID